MINDSYTISLEDVINDIWLANHDNEVGVLDMLKDFKTAKKEMEEKIEYAIPTIFDFDFECYGDDSDKLHLEKSILKKYFTRDICCDSLLRWQLYLEEKLNDIMPRYVALYNAQAQLLAQANNLYNPYFVEETKDRNVKDVISGNGTNKSTSNSTANANSNSKTNNTSSDVSSATSESGQKYSDTPQSEIDYDTNYLTNYTGNKSDSSSKDDSTSTTTDENASTSKSDTSNTSEYQDDTTKDKTDVYTKVIKGNLGKQSYAQLTKAYEDVILNIEKLITDELNDLFYLVY